MSAITRWVQYNVTSTSTAGTGGDTNQGRGTRGYVAATTAVDDTFIIGANNNRLYLTIDGNSTPSYITITTSGLALDPRLVAKEITEQIHGASVLECYQRAQCVWTNNHFKIYSGSLGSASSIIVSSGTNTAHLELGFGTNSAVGGFATGNTSTGGGITVSGTYNGFFDEIYHVVVAGAVNVNTPSKGGGNTYNGTISVNSVVKTGSAITYTLKISTTNGTTMGGGTGNVPVLTWTTTAAIDDSTNSSDSVIEKRPIELLFSNYWYSVGTKGLMVKFSDAVFNSCDPGWTVVCDAITTVDGSNASAPKGTAKYVWSSSRGDNTPIALLTSNGGFTRLGSRGLTIRFDVTSNLYATDEFYVVCSPPQPASLSTPTGITALNFGNVTVSTESPVRVVMFEIMSGAVEISTVKFGLQSHGTFAYHDGSPTGTKLRFGTVGPGNNAGTSPTNGYEWWPSVTAADISSNSPPGYLYATKADLGVVSDADNSESIGISTYMGMCADPIWMNIKLGNSEVGANSTINYRVYFDYS
jgi:hypothetical protein